MPLCKSSINGHKPTVLVADATRMNCQLVSDAIQRHGHFRVVDHVTSSTEVISAVRNARPDIVVISVSLQDGDSAGLSALQGLRALHASSRIVMLVDKEERQMVVEAFLNGTRGVFCRMGSSTDLRKCIRSIHNGELWISNAQLEYVVDALVQAPSLRLPTGSDESTLSKRELEIARLVATGLSNLEVSDKLGLSRHTVKNYLFRIFEKLKISTRMELVLFILSQAPPSEVTDTIAPAPAGESAASRSSNSAHRSTWRAPLVSAMTPSLVVNRKLLVS